ncbi:MFS transporter [Georgenia sp. Z1491]|uniref:MFS transporter n=1 Tax=Georgenia sp. Z1491 TaxID=3416707 RepID=UPI003CF2E20D
MSTPAAPAAADGPMFPFRPIVLGAMVPTFLLEVGVGAALPIVVTRATDLGASLGVASLLAALVPVGQILADLPAGGLTARVGDRWAMVVAGLVAVVGFVLGVAAGSVVVLGAAALLLGGAQSVFAIARHAYLTSTTAPQRRARVLSTIAGVFRAGLFVGPFVGAAVLLAASTRWAFAVGAVTSLLAVVVVLAAGGSAADRPSPAPHGAGRQSMRAVVGRHRAVLVRLGAVAVTIAAVRGARQTVLPIWAEHIGLDGATTSVIFGVAAGMDMLLFYPCGQVMDRFGRLWVGVPGMAIMGLALAAIPLTGTAGQLGAAGLVLGIGNGITSGILMTIGSDAAPADGQAQFLAAWRLQGDLGAAASPLVLAAGPALGSLAVAVWVTSAVAAVSIGVQRRWLPRYSVHANRSTRRAAGLRPDGSLPTRLDE